MDTPFDWFMERCIDGLQWSHDLSAMDTLTGSSRTFVVKILQWSHDLSAMDTWMTF